MVHMEENARKQPSYICVCSLCPLFSFNQIAYSSRIRYNISTSIQRMKRFDNATINNECPSEIGSFSLFVKKCQRVLGRRQPIAPGVDYGNSRPRVVGVSSHPTTSGIQFDLFLSCLLSTLQPYYAITTVLAIQKCKISLSEMSFWCKEYLI